MTWVDDLTSRTKSSEPPEAVTWIWRHWVLLVAAILILAGLAEKAIVLRHGYFRQDDFYLFDWALRTRFGWSLAGTVYAGHFMPGGLALAWSLAHLSVYNWALASAVNVALLAAASLALLRLLRTIFGTRPAILVPLLVYLLCPLALPGLTFWSTTISWLPAQLAIFLAVNAHVHYLRSGQYWHAVAAAAWLAFGLLFDEASLFVPLLLLGLTSAFFVSGGWARATVSVLARFWRGWVLYLAVAGGYLALLLSQLHASSPAATRPVQFSSVLTFVSALARVSFVPAALGGPWHWYASGSYGFADEVSWLTPLSWAVAGLVILASLWFRRHAWRAWVILAAWTLLTALVPILLGRVSLASPSLLGTDLQYLAASLPVLAICLGLGFWPVQGEPAPYRAPNPMPRWLQPAAIAVVLACFTAGALYSCSSYLTDTTSAPESSYIATVRAALARTPAGTFIWSTPVPSVIQDVQRQGTYGSTQTVAGVLAPAAQHLIWTTAPSGVIGTLDIFDSSGRLWGVQLNGWTMHAPARKLGCWSVTSRPIQIAITPATPYVWSWELDLSYNGPAATLAIEFAGVWQDRQLPSGQHQLWIPVHGSASSLQARLLGGGPRECLSSVTIGASAEPSVLSRPVPASPVSG